MKATIISKNYSESNSRRQPWYSISALCNDFNEKGLITEIINDSSELNCSDCFKIKTLGIRELLFPSKIRSSILIISFPLYPLHKFLRFRFYDLFKIWKVANHILIAALLPSFFLRNVLNKADYNFVISDRSHDYLKSLGVKNILRYYPYKFNNWSGIRLTRKRDRKKILRFGYIGPPVRSRGFDISLSIFIKLRKRFKCRFKILSRIDSNKIKVEGQNIIKDHTKYPEIEHVDDFLNREDLAKQLSNIDYMFLPFRMVLSELPIVALECLELGIPIITTKDSGIVNLVKDSRGIYILEDYSVTKTMINHIEKFVKKNDVVNFDKIRRDINSTNLKSFNILTKINEKEI